MARNNKIKSLDELAVCLRELKAAGKRIVGSWGGGCVPERDTERFAQLYETGALPLAKLVTHTYGLELVNQALDDLELGRIGRALIDLARP